jgi:hypothetical protein
MTFQRSPTRLEQRVGAVAGRGQARAQDRPRPSRLASAQNQGVQVGAVDARRWREIEQTAHGGGHVHQAHEALDPGAGAADDLPVLRRAGRESKTTDDNEDHGG